MDWTHLLAFNLTLLAALAAPGPALLFALRQAITGGFWVGLATGLGLALMAATWTAAALLGLEAVFALFPWAFLLIKTLGAAYLIWVAYGLWRDASKPLSDSATPGRKAFLGGLLVNLANPKSVLFAASVLVVIFPAGLTLSEKAFIVTNHLLVEVIAYGSFAALLSTPPARAGYLRLKPVFDRVAGAILGLLGLKLLVGK
ncbi:Threonine efflux protein [Pelagimonas phthalicica]|uniref:Threonine efflux protein n=1 Tax=Pelagimonas phthalicica TaxID=1037362 RepID=A0A238JD67_9RHOB|nr:LysE family transporter [Pelagimonas phthalicica]TDS91307.1 threonine/homoserine/homoserine lactone efflux protein [Pelagimonas phthalicica]SMX28355.1 Threonine efflux protein [Pelagimonas phthalicica]